MRTRIHRAEYESAASLHAKVNTPRLRDEPERPRHDRPDAT